MIVWLIVAGSAVSLAGCAGQGPAFDSNQERRIIRTVTPNVGVGGLVPTSVPSLYSSPMPTAP